MMPESDVPRIVEPRMALAREWDRLVDEVRALDGFEDFLRPPRIETLLPAAEGGPVAMINVSRWRCDALLVRPTGVEVVELPGLSIEAVTERILDYLRVLHKVDLTARELHLSRAALDGGDFELSAVQRYTDAKFAWQAVMIEREATLAATFRWLWDDIADPVLSALRLDRTPGPGEVWPRLWWCPTGPLTLLPLHAAGYHEDSGVGRTVLDRVVSSYTPTLRALREARRPLAVAADSERMLIVALSDTPDRPSLDDVVRERDLLTTLFRDRHTLLDGEAATADAVREQLPRHRWAHFSCHGGQNLADPSQGGLLLHDRVLTVHDISARQHQGEFAFLSACMTALGGLNLSDEAITLAAALHYTGYRQVIGTLWTVYDETAADVAEKVYGRLAAGDRFDPTGAALALHQAIRELRDVERLPASVWSPFTHTGP
jgi:hypothetical protein